MRHDTLSDIFSILKNAERVGKKECIVPASTLVEDVLKVMQSSGYIGKFDKFKVRYASKFRVELLGKINDCRVIKPRFPVANGEFGKWEKRYLPGSDFGTIILTTSKGVMSHEEAKSKKVGGALLGFIY